MKDYTKNILIALSVSLSFSIYGQYNSVKTNSKKELNVYLKNIKDDTFFDQTLISSNAIRRQISIKNAVLDRITVYDTLGRLQKSLFFLNNSEHHTIDLSELAKGVYFVILENNNKTAKRKININ